MKKKYLEKCALEQSSGRMKQEDNMRCTNNICVLINFDVVKIQELMHKINAELNTRSKNYEVN